MAICHYKPLKFHAMAIVVRSVFEEDGKMFQMNICMSYKNDCKKYNIKHRP